MRIFFLELRKKEEREVENEKKYILPKSVIMHVIKGFFYQMQGTKACTVLKQSQPLQMHFLIHL